MFKRKKVEENEVSKYKNGRNRSNNYMITIKIDADIEGFFKNISIVSFIETAKKGKGTSTTKNEYVNDLIREKMLETYKSNKVSNWQEYKAKNNIE